MREYLIQLRKDFETGVLLMDCIVLDAYEWLVSNGYLTADSFHLYKQAAATYRMAQMHKYPRTLQQSFEDPYRDLEKKHQLENTLKENIAKKMAVYDWVRECRILMLPPDS